MTNTCKFWLEIIFFIHFVMTQGQRLPEVSGFSPRQDLNPRLWLGLGQPFMVWVWIWEISPKNVKFFNFFLFGSKKIFSGQVRKYPGQRRVGLLYCRSKVSSGWVRAHLYPWPSDPQPDAMTIRLSYSHSFFCTYFHIIWKNGFYISYSITYYSSHK